MVPHWFVHQFSRAVALWQESGENPAVFCYLIGWGTFAGLRSRQFVPIVPSERPETPCWNPSATCCTRSTVPKASEN